MRQKDNTDDNSFDTTYATESTDSTSVSVKHNTDNYELNRVILHVNKATHVLLKLSGVSEKEKRIINHTGNFMPTVLFLSLRASLEDPDNRREKPLTCNMEPNICHAQQWKLVYNKRKIKKKKLNKRYLADPIKHKAVPVSFDLEPDIAVMQSKLISKMKRITSNTRQLVDSLMHSMEPLSCDLELDIMIRYTEIKK